MAKWGYLFRAWNVTSVALNQPIPYLTIARFIATGELQPLVIRPLFARRKAGSLGCQVLRRGRSSTARTSS